MTTTRRGFLGRIAAMIAAPVVAKFTPTPVATMPTIVWGPTVYGESPGAQALREVRALQPDQPTLLEWARKVEQEHPGIDKVYEIMNDNCRILEDMAWIHEDRKGYTVKL